MAKILGSIEPRMRIEYAKLKDDILIAKSRFFINVDEKSYFGSQQFFHIFNVLSIPIAVRKMVILTASSVDNFCPNCENCEKEL